MKSIKALMLVCALCAASSSFAKEDKNDDPIFSKKVITEAKTDNKTKTLTTVEPTEEPAVEKESTTTSIINYIKDINTRYSWAKYAEIGTGVVAIVGLSAWLLSGSTENDEEIPPYEEIAKI